MQDTDRWHPENMIRNQTHENEHQHEIEINQLQNLTISARLAVCVKNRHLLWKTAVIFAEPGGESRPFSRKDQCWRGLIIPQYFNGHHWPNIAKQSQTRTLHPNKTVVLARFLVLQNSPERLKKDLGKNKCKDFSEWSYFSVSVKLWSCEVHTETTPHLSHLCNPG